MIIYLSEYEINDYIDESLISSEVILRKGNKGLLTSVSPLMVNKSVINISDLYIIKSKDYEYIIIRK